MRHKILLAIVLVFVAVALVALPASADKGKKKPDQVVEKDPYANRWGFSVGGGGVSSSAGFGFQVQVGVTYYINKWVNLSLSPGFGMYPVDFEYSLIKNNHEETKTDTVYVKYVPVDLAVIFTPVRFSNYSIYMGPGVGMTYYWWTQKERDSQDLSVTQEKDMNETLYSTFFTAGVGIAMGGPFVVSIGATYRIPDVTDFSFDTGVFDFGIGGGVVF